jgi:Domain of unknown function (DUF5655)
MRLTTDRTDSLFTDKDPRVVDTYNRIVEAIRACGPFQTEVKKTSIHLVHAVGFAGIHPRKSYLYLNLRTALPIESPRIVRVERVSKHRYHNEVKLTSPSDVDAEVVGWLRDAYAVG